MSDSAPPRRVIVSRHFFTGKSFPIERIKKSSTKMTESNSRGLRSGELDLAFFVFLVKKFQDFVSARSIS